MARPPAVTGGRPNQITVRLSDTELTELDKRRGSLDRPTYIRQAALTTTVPGRTPGIQHRDIPVMSHESHRHRWVRSSDLIDICAIKGCGEDRPHQAGTR